MTKIVFLNDTSKSMRLDFRFRRVSVCQRARGFVKPLFSILCRLKIPCGFYISAKVKPFGKRLSPSAEMSNPSGNDFRHARKCQTLRETTFAKRGSF